MKLDFFYYKKPSENYYSRKLSIGDFRNHKCNDMTKIVPIANQKVVLRKISGPECTLHNYELSIVYCIVILLCKQIHSSRSKLQCFEYLQNHCNA